MRQSQKYIQSSDMYTTTPFRPPPMKYEYELVVSSLAWKDLHSAHDKLTRSLCLWNALERCF